MNLGLERKVALVTGGAKGIGAAIVRSFLRKVHRLPFLIEIQKLLNLSLMRLVVKKEEIFAFLLN